jgi:hypothetical protein
MSTKVNLSCSLKVVASHIYDHSYWIKVSGQLCAAYSVCWEERVCVSCWWGPEIDCWSEYLEERVTALVGAGN